MRAGTFIRWSGLALLVWAAQMIVKDFIFAFTHGTTEAAMGDRIFGLNSSQYSVVWTPFALLGVAGLVGLYAVVSSRLGRAGNASLAVAIIGLALSFVGGVMQFWILDVDTYFSSPLVLGGWILWLLSLLITTIGLIIAGADIARAHAMPGARYLVLVIGLLALPTFFLRSWVVGNSDDTLAWRLLYGSLSVPYDLCWAWLGSVLIRAGRDPAPALASTPPRPG